MSMSEKRVEAARRAFEDHQWNPTTRLCTCGEFFEASLAGHELRDAHRMGEVISAADAVGEEKIAEAIATVIETHKDTIGTHWPECWKYHAGCLAVLLRELGVK